MASVTAMNQPEPVISNGAVIAFRLFDIAYEIDLAKVERVWAARARTASRGRLTGTPPKAVKARQRMRAPEVTSRPV